MRVTVRGFTVIRDILGASAVEVDVDHPGTVKGVFDALLSRYGAPLKAAICEPGTGDLTAFPVRLNDEIISSVLGVDSPVKSGDEIAIIFPVGGGC